MGSIERIRSEQPSVLVSINQYLFQVVEKVFLRHLRIHHYGFISCISRRARITYFLMFFEVFNLDQGLLIVCILVFIVICFLYSCYPASFDIQCCRTEESNIQILGRSSYLLLSNITLSTFLVVTRRIFCNVRCCVFVEICSIFYFVSSRRAGFFL